MDPTSPPARAVRDPPSMTRYRATTSVCRNPIVAVVASAPVPDHVPTRSDVKEEIVGVDPDPDPDPDLRHGLSEEANGNSAAWTPEMADYVSDVVRHRKALEVQACLPVGFMSWQTKINVKMRAILVDWLWSVWFKFKLRPETLFLGLQLIDRYLAKQPCARKQLQLVGVTAMFVAAKVEEVYFPEARDWVYTTDRAYTRKEVLDMEGTLIRALDYSLSLPTAYSFIQYYSHSVQPGCPRTCRAAVFAFGAVALAVETASELPSRVAFGCVMFALMNRHRLKAHLVPRCPSGPDGAKLPRECAESLCELAGESLEHAVRRLERCAQLPRSCAAAFFARVAAYLKDGTLMQAAMLSRMFPDAAALWLQVQMFVDAAPAPQPVP